MSDNKAINSMLSNIFKSDEWSSVQYNTYKAIQQYVDEFKGKKRIYETKDDLGIIRNNLKDQLWYKYSKSKPIISHLLDNMKLISHTYDENTHGINFNLSISFDKFQVHACLYKNISNNFINYYIYFENKQARAYLSYYIKPFDPEFKVNCKLPDLNKIYEITNLSKNIICQCDLLNLFSEIIMYYDDSSTIGDLPISNDVSVTLNQLIEKSNSYLSQKKSEIDYKWGGGAELPLDPLKN